MTHGMLLHFLYCSEIYEISLVVDRWHAVTIWHLQMSLANDKWHAITFLEIWNLYEISVINDTWHAVTILFRKLTSTFQVWSPRVLSPDFLHAAQSDPHVKQWSMRNSQTSFGHNYFRHLRLKVCVWSVTIICIIYGIVHKSAGSLFLS